jgi:hypothetical protein
MQIVIPPSASAEGREETKHQIVLSERSGIEDGREALSFIRINRPGNTGRESKESSILAQDERWRRA